MKTRDKLILTVGLGLFFLGPAQAQVAKSSYNSAFSVLNTGSTTVAATTSLATQTPASSAYVGNAADTFDAGVSPIMVTTQPMNARYRIRFGVPTQIAFDYAYLRSRMVSAYEENPDLYNNGSAEFQEAVDILGWTDFVTISSWAPVRCTVKFYFVPPILDDKNGYNFTYNYQYNPNNTPVKGTSTFWVR